MNFRDPWWVLLFLTLTGGLLLAAARGVPAHDAEMATSKEQAEVFEMYAKWNRPAGFFSGIEHRKKSCCDKADCGVVIETRWRDGKREIRVRNEFLVAEAERYWYVVPPVLEEVNQPDPVESPDGRAHACIQGEMVVCYTGGAGG